MKTAAIRKATALILTLVMLMTCAGAWGTTETATVEVDASLADQILSVEVIDIDESTPVGTQIIGLDVTTNGHEADVNVQKGIDVDGDNAALGSYGVDIEMEGDNGKADISVGEDISTTDSKHSSGIVIDVSGQTGNDVTVDVDGSVKATTTGTASVTGYTDARGVEIYPAGSSDTHVVVDIGEDLKAEGGRSSCGLRISTEEMVEVQGSTADVHVGGDVSAKSTDTASGYAAGVYVEGVGTEQETLQIDGMILATGTGSATGIFADSRESGNAIDIDVDKSVVALSSGNAKAVHIVNEENGTISVEAEGSMLTNASGNAIATAVDIENRKAGTVTVGAEAIEGFSNSDKTGVVKGAAISAQGDGKTEVTAGEGGIKARDAGNGNTLAVDIVGSAGEVSVQTKGMISGETKTGSAGGIGISAVEDVSVDISAAGVSAVTPEGGDASALTLSIADEASVKMTAGEKGISASSKGDGRGAFGIRNIQYGGTVEITSGGDISAETTGDQHGFARTISANVFDDSSMKVKADGSITATTAGDGEAVAVDLELFGADADIRAGKDVKADTKGISLSQNQTWESTSMTEEQYQAVKDKAYHVPGDPENVFVYMDRETNTEYSFYVKPDNTLGNGVVTRYYDEEATATVAVGGSVIVRNDAGTGANTTGVELTSENGKAGTAINIGEDIDVQGKNKVYGVNAELSAGEASIETGDDITVQSDTDADAIYARISNTGSLTVHVGGGMTAVTTGERSAGAAMTVRMNGGILDAEIDGDVTADRTGINIRDYGADEDEADPFLEGKANVNVHGGINVEARGGSTDTEALSLLNLNQNMTMGANIDGDISITGDENIDAIGLTADGGVIKVKTGGDVSAITKDFGSTGVDAAAVNGGDLELDVGGSITVSAGSDTIANDDAVGLNAWAGGADSKLKITVAGGVTAEAKNVTESATAIQVTNRVENGKSGNVEITVNGDVNSSGKAISIVGEAFGDEREFEYLEGTAEVKEEELFRTEYRTAEDHKGVEAYKVYYNAEGDYYYNEFGTMWRETEAESGLTKVEVNGDVTGDDVGLYVNARAITDVIIDGTLDGGNHAVVIADESVADNLMLTVWEIKPNEDGSVAETGLMNEDGGLDTEEYDEFEKQIQYIIRLEQPEAGATLSSEGTYEYEGYTVAHENDTVTLKINIEPGYEIVDAYNGTDTKVSLMKDANGQYYLVVPRGGAVLLSVKLRRVETARKALTGTALSKTCKITVDPNGGTLKGSTEPIVETVGRYQSFTLPEAPEKKGETFLGWYGTPFTAADANWKAPEEGSAKLLPAGSSVKVTRDYCYTAVWKAE